MGNESGREPSFKVQDRRRFSATGEAREDVADERAEETRQGETAPSAETPRGDAPRGDSPADSAAHGPAGSEPASGAEAGEITFASFVFSLSTQALIHLGEIPDPSDGAARVNLEAARQIIDIVAVLRDKTRGNLDAAENSLLESALYDLRMRYVERARNG